MKRHSLAFLFAVALLVAACTPRPSPVENLEAFARMYGYVRFFHPSDAAAELDWDRFAVHGMREVRDAGSRDDLHAALEELFMPVAPTVQIYETADGPPAPPAILRPAEGEPMDLVAWQHLGVELGAEGRSYRSLRLNRPPTGGYSRSEASIYRKIDATPYRGRDVRLRGMVRLNEVTGDARASITLYTELTPMESGFVDYMEGRPITSTEWDTYQVSGTVEMEADSIGFGGSIAGAASASFDEFLLEVRGDDDWDVVPLANAGFESGDIGALPPQWRFAGRGFQPSVSDINPAVGQRTMTLAFGETLFDQRPTPGEVVRRELGNGLSVQLPLALYSRDDRTLRPADAPSPSDLFARLDAIEASSLNLDDESVRLAGVVITWNILQHFYPYFDEVETDWHAVLSTTLEDAMDDEGAADFVRTMRRMVAALQDGHGFVWHPIVTEQASLPFQADFVEGRVVIVAREVFEPVEIGDVVLAVDDEPIDDYLSRRMAFQSGSEHWKRLKELMSFGQGPKGDSVRVRLLRDGEELEVVLRRTTTNVIARPLRQQIGEIEAGIFYVDLTRATMEEISGVMQDLSTANGVIFDLRGYPNATDGVLAHLADSTYTSATFDAPQVIYPDREQMTFDSSSQWVRQPREPRITGTVVFLTNASAISWSESILEAVAHHRLGQIVGQPTAGANGDVNLVRLPGDVTISFSGRRVRKQDGSQLHTVGVLPSVPVHRTLEGVRQERDEFLETALDLIRSRRDE